MDVTIFFNFMLGLFNAIGILDVLKAFSLGMLIIGASLFLVNKLSGT